MIESSGASLEVHMMKNIHLTQSDRIIIEQLLNNRCSFRFIAQELSKDPTTISKEVKNHILYKQIGAYGKAFNNCLHRYGCTLSGLCSKPGCRKKLCWNCATTSCTTICEIFKKSTCTHLSKPPYVCNGCETRRKCTLEKQLYSASYAQKEYESIRSESRQGIQLSESEALRLNFIISPLLKKGQSLHHICINHMDKIMCGERTLYNYVNYNIFTARNIDMPRSVRMGKRKPKRNFKIDKKCRIGRTYDDFINFIEEHPHIPIVQMDTLEGIKGGKVLLTIHFTVPQLMIAFIRDANTSQSVIDIINQLYSKLQPDTFLAILSVVLTDNGSEFSNPQAIEFDKEGNRRTNIFYCDPAAPYQKGAVENNHELIRRVIPKGKSLDEYTQNDINLMMNHINSYRRKNLGDKSPYEVFAMLYGEDILRKMETTLIPPDEIMLVPSLLKK